MKKLLTVIFSILIFTGMAFAAEPAKVQLGRIEQSIWGFEYSKDSDVDRLERIETSVLGSATPKKPVAERLKLLNDTLGIDTLDGSDRVAQEVQDIESGAIAYPMVDKLEMKVLSQTYGKENVYARLERLEQKVYGSKQQGDLDTRLNKLVASADINVAPGLRDSDLYLQVALLENTLFKETYDQDPLELRLNRLERKIFQRDFSTDEEQTRLQRLQAASTAKKTAKYYDSNKAAKYASSGVQIGTLILMILALIL